jgi:hypothetical protein
MFPAHKALNLMDLDPEATYAVTINGETSLGNGPQIATLIFTDPQLMFVGLDDFERIRPA